MLTDKQQLYQRRNQNRSYKALRKNVVTLTQIEDVYYKDILPQHREEFTRYFAGIWELPLIRSERSSRQTQAFWKRTITQSFLAGKSDIYNKQVIRYGEHPRQKFSIHYPKTKPTNAKVVMYVHGGVFINGTEESFEYLGKHFVEAGYILVTIGFRQLPQYNYYDSLLDVDTAFKKCIGLISQYGGDANEVVVLTWLGGVSTAIPAICQDRKFYDNHVKLVIVTGAAFRIDDFLTKITPALFDFDYETHHLYLYNYMEQPLKQRIDFVCGSRQMEFPFIYQQNVDWVSKFKNVGFDTEGFMLNNHDHFEMILTPYFCIERIQEYELKKIDPNNQLASLLYMSGIHRKEQLFAGFEQQLWRKASNNKQNASRKLFEQLVTTINNTSLKQDPVSHFQLYEAAAPISPFGLELLITHNTACSAINQLGGDYHRNIIEESEKCGRPIAVCLDQLGCQSPRQVGTSALYIAKSNQYILDSISRLFRKYWSDGLGEDSCVDYALVFAKTVVNTKTRDHEGVNPFLIKIRNTEQGVLVKGITISNIGQHEKRFSKGLIKFTKCLLPKESLLEGLVKVSDEGKVSSKIKPHSRVGEYLDRMTYSHQALSSCALGLIKATLYTAVRFSKHRWTVSETHKLVNPLFNLQMQQHVVVPLMAKALAYSFAHNLSKQYFIEAPTTTQSVVLSNLCKAKMSSFATTAISSIIDCTGRLGLSVHSRLVEYLKAAKGYCCEAGDNRSLTIKACQGLVHLHENGSLHYKKTSMNTSDIAQLKSVEYLLGLLMFRESALFDRMVAKFSKLRSQAKTPFEIYTRYLSNDQLAYADAYFDRIALQQTLQAVAKLKESDNIDLVMLFARIFATRIVHDEAALFLMKGAITSSVAQQLGDWLDGLVKQGSLKANVLLEMWNIRTTHLNIPIAQENYEESMDRAVQNSNRPRL